MNRSDLEYQDEQQRVHSVTAKIDKQIKKLDIYTGGIGKTIVGIRKAFWDDVTINFDDFNESVETMASIKQQAELLSERERSHRMATQKLKTLLRLKDSPYFGRVDFTEKDESISDRIYIGIGSFLDEANDEFLIYDWRAPISSLYYDYSPGPAQYETLDGTISGNMDLKRQFIIRGGKMVSLFDTGVTIGDELLQEVLGKQANAQMKSIVATIQKEQNQIIRNESSHLLIVQGAAGSGKTSAALQRVAYLLYRHRETLNADQIVLFSPNPMFNSYVSTVLPELGEENMQQTTFQDYLAYRIGHLFELEDPFDQLEYTLTAMDDAQYPTRLAGIRYKATPDFLQFMNRYIDFLGQDGLIFKDLMFRGQPLISAERIKDQSYSLDPSWSLPNRLQWIRDWLINELKDHARLERSKQWVEDEMELLDHEDYVKVFQQMEAKNHYTEDSFDDYDRERERLATLIVKRRFKPLTTKVRRLAFIDIPAIYQQLFSDKARVVNNLLPDDWVNICEQTTEQLESGKLLYEDATPFLYLKERLEGFHTNTTVRHVFIDEVQDYTPFQLTFFKRLFPKAKMTVLGDMNQAIFAAASELHDIHTLESLYGVEKAETMILTRSYRSTRPIILFTRHLVPDGDRIEPFNRDGHKPTVTRVPEGDPHIGAITARVQSLKAEGHQTIAIICKTAKESRATYDALRNKIDLFLIHKETGSFKSGIVVIPSYLAKGVEFDAVIIYNASDKHYSKESERKLFYTACTRAMHELDLFYTGTLSPFVGAVPPDTYTHR